MIAVGKHSHPARFRYEKPLITVKPQESNSGDEDFRCRTVRKTNVDGISRPVGEKSCLPQICTGQWRNLRLGSLEPAGYCFGASSLIFIQFEAFAKYFALTLQARKCLSLMLETWRVATPSHLLSVLKAPYMLAETATGERCRKRPIVCVADSRFVIRGRHLDRDLRVYIPMKTPEKVDTVGTKRNAVETCSQAGRYI